MKHIILCCILLLTSFTQAMSQNPRLNKYGLVVIERVKEYEKTIAGNYAKRMVNIRSYIPGIKIDLRYSINNNFTGHRLYPEIKTTYIRFSAVEKLMRIEKELNTKGLGLKIWDAYRPYSITEKMWEPVKDDRYAADPKKGSGHNRGVAIDLTIINLSTQQELDMGTSFDNFSDTAHHGFSLLSDTVKSNRDLLRRIMESNGFKALESEWWHYYLPDHMRYELLNLSFREMDRISRKKNISL